MAYDPPPNAGFLGQLLLELPPDSWLPEGYTLTPKPRADGSTPPGIAVRNPAGQSQQIYPDPTFSASPPRRESIFGTIRRELGPIPTDGLWSPAQREWLGMNRPDLVGDADRAFYGVGDGVAWLFDLAGYGLSASILATTEGLHRTGVMSQTDANRLRRDLNLGALVVGAEDGMRPRATVPPGAGAAEMLARAQAAQERLAAIARAAVIVGAVTLRQVSDTGLPFGRLYGTVDKLWALVDASKPGAAAPALPRYRQQWAAGNAFDAQQAANYDFNQIYVVSLTAKSGYVRLDSYLEIGDAARAAGPVSRKLTQLAEVQPQTVIKYLREAYDKYRPGRMFADVPSTPPRLRNTPIKGQLVLEVPVQTLAIPQTVLAEAKRLQIIIRDISGKVY